MTDQAVRVPRDPTDAMLKRGGQEFAMTHQRMQTAEDCARDVWRAMIGTGRYSYVVDPDIAAAPSPEAEGAGQPYDRRVVRAIVRVTEWLTDREDDLARDAEDEGDMVAVDDGLMEFAREDIRTLLQVLTGNLPASTCGIAPLGDEPKSPSREVAWRTRGPRGGWMHCDVRPASWKDAQPLFDHPAPSPASAWKPTHRHRGGMECVIVGEGEVQTTDGLCDYDAVTIYREENGRLWVRSTAEFNDGRFMPLPTPPATEGAGDQ